MTKSVPIAVAGGLLLLGAPAWAASTPFAAGDARLATISRDAPLSRTALGDRMAQMQMGGAKTETPTGRMMGGGMMGRRMGGAIEGPGQAEAVSEPGYGMMRAGGMRMMGMMSDHIEGRLAFLKTELRITDAQTPKWDAFVDAVRAGAKTMTTMWQGMMPQEQETLPARLQGNVKALTARLEALQKIETALDPLYASFTEEQKKTADQLMVSPMGMIGMM